jgi:2-keto-4-pentenoate hydratase/2-oxohepta-3-ene-1,7-dioic acid hydratase in catechol pathway
MLIARAEIDGVVSHAVVDLADGRIRRLAGSPFAGLRPEGDPRPIGSVRLLAPVEPSKVLVVGRNYGEPGTAPPGLVLNLKPSTAVIGPDDPIVLPADVKEVRYEGELAVVIGRRCRDVAAGRVAEVVFGYTCANDVTAWDVGASGGHWTKAKSFDTFCPLGPWIQTELHHADSAILTTVNGVERQNGSTREMFRGVDELVSECSRVMTLLPGDVILTGTPDGSATMRSGDSIAVAVAGIGVLTNPVRGEEPAP